MHLVTQWVHTFKTENIKVKVALITQLRESKGRNTRDDVLLHTKIKVGH